MTPRAERALWIAAAAGALAAVVLAYQAPPRPDVAAPKIESSLPAILSFDRDRLAAAADRTVAYDPFRLDRRPANAAFGQSENVGTRGEAPRPPVPSLRFKGLVGGPPWQAVLEGVPGRAGDVVVRAGDTLAGLRIHRITADRLVITGADSSITLTPYHAWP